MMLFLIDQRFKQAVFQFSRGSILLATSLYKPLLMKNKSKMASMMKKIFLSGNISITKVYLVTKFFQCSYQGLSFDGFSLKIELVVFVYELIIYL